MLALASRPAHACDDQYETSYDLHDRATTVVLGKLDSLAGTKGSLTVIETFKGSAGAKLTLTVDVRSTCSPNMKVGQQGVVFLDASGAMLGEYDGFERNAKVIAALRGYSSSTAETRAKALLDLAVSKDWSPSYRAAFALANRPELVGALDSKAKDRVIARLPKVMRKEHPLTFVAARTRDARTAKLVGKLAGAARLKAVMSGTFQAETDPARLADKIALAATSVIDRVAAMERCEQLRGRSLAPFTSYSAASEQPDWKQLAEACRTGKPI